MIIKTSFGRVALRQFPADEDVWEACKNDLLDICISYGQALFDRASGAEPDLSAVPLAVARRLIAQSTKPRISEDQALGMGDLLALVDGIYKVNQLESLGKMAARRAEMEMQMIARRVNTPNPQKRQEASPTV